MTAKKKVTQDELRRLMSLQKSKLLSSGPKKIESPLAKYDKTGQLTCIICESIVRSEAVWTVHINSKGHRENISKKAKRKESPAEVEEPPKKIFMPPPAPPEIKPVKSILKNPIVPKTPAVPEDFFDATKKPEPAEKAGSSKEAVNGGEMMEMEEEQQELPEGFFDDPKLDAKVRNVEYKDPIEEEWELFQKEIKEETSKAQVIISEDQEEATNERQIDEIDEQMRHWNRVVHLEKKKKEAVPVVTHVKEEPEDEDMDEDDFDEHLDWRSKKSFR